MRREGRNKGIKKTTEGRSEHRRKKGGQKNGRQEKTEKGKTEEGEDIWSREERRRTRK